MVGVGVVLDGFVVNLLGGFVVVLGCGVVFSVGAPFVVG